MPEKKNPRKQNLGLWLAVLIVVIVVVLPIPVWARAVIIIVLAAAFAFWRRSIIYFLIGNRKMAGDEKKGKTPDLESAWNWYRKAWDAHIRLDYGAIIGSTFIQRGDVEYGKKILETVISRMPGTDLEKSTKVALSMALWRLDDLQGAIDVLEEVRASGYSDKNLYVNLGTYLLEKGEYRRAKKINDEAKKIGPESPGITDNRGWYYIATGDWNNARKLYDELTDERRPRFPEAYVHGAQVKLHFGDVEGAIEQLERALAQKFVLTTGVSREVIEQMLEDLRNPQTRKSAAAAIDASAVIVAAGGAPLGASDAMGAASVAPVVSADAPEPVAEKPPVALVEASEDEEADDDLAVPAVVDDGPTDEEMGLVCDDYAEDEDEDEPDTSVDDDDEREPNTELDESDYLYEDIDSDDEDADEDESEDSFYDLDDDDDRDPNIELDDDDDLYEDDDPEEKT
ncbi:MAG: tetratricopeptide repeat protein [Sphaerochaetaceae bacterium]|jgi:hypothetical protein